MIQISPMERLIILAMWLGAEKQCEMMLMLAINKYNKAEFVTDFRRPVT